MLSSSIKRARLKLRADGFSSRVINCWNSLPVTVVEAPSLNAFESLLSTHWKNHPTKFEAACYRAVPSEGQYRNAPQEVGETFLGVDNR